MSDKLLKQFLAAAEEAGITHLAPTQADRLVEQLRQLENHSFRMGELFAKYQGKGWPEAEGNVFTTLRDETVPALRASILVAALAKQQASPDAQQEWKVGNTVTIRPTRMEVFGTPSSAPQAAGAALTDTRIGELSYFSVDVRGPRLDQFKFARAVEAEVLAKEREQAALPAPQEKELRRMLCAAIGGGLAYMDDGEAQFESIDFLRWPVDAIQSALKHRALRLVALAQGTTPAAGVGEQAKAEPMSDERIDAHFDAFQNDRRILGDHAAFYGVVRDILAEAGIKEKT